MVTLASLPNIDAANAHKYPLSGTCTEVAEKNKVTVEVEGTTAPSVLVEVHCEEVEVEVNDGTGTGTMIKRKIKKWKAELDLSLFENTSLSVTVDHNLKSLSAQQAAGSLNNTFILQPCQPCQLCRC